MSSSIIDYKYEISPIEVITTCISMIIASTSRVCHKFTKFVSYFVELSPHMVTLRNFDVPTFIYSLTCFTSVPHCHIYHNVPHLP